MFCTIFYADDTVLHMSCPTAQLDDMCDKLSSCMDDIKGWTVKNKLKLNETRRRQRCWGSRQYCPDSWVMPLFLQAVEFPLHLRWRALVLPLTLPCPWNSKSALCVGLATATSDRYTELESFWARSQSSNLFLALLSAAWITVILCPQIFPLKVSRRFKMFKIVLLASF